MQNETSPSSHLQRMEAGGAMGFSACGRRGWGRPEARQRIAPFVSRELQGGILCAAIPPAMQPTFEATPGLTFIGYEALFTPTPIVGAAERGGAEPNATGHVPAMIDTVRACIL